MLPLLVVRNFLVGTLYTYVLVPAPVAVPLGSLSCPGGRWWNATIAMESEELYEGSSISN